MQALRQSRPFRGLHWSCWKRFLTHSCTGNEYLELSSDVKHRIETHWKGQISGGQFDAKQPADKFYVLSMFPYPSGNLHMGHVRVYTIGDAVARFQRMCGKNVFQPIGWDSFGLPAENAANQRGVEPAAWTEQNIAQMKQQLQRLGCSFDWTHELSTCSPQYYRWTQQLFLMLHKHGLAYQNEALVNWDPVDQTVLADEQVDANGCSWRSGAKVEKKLLKQWFIRTTAYAKQLLDGLDDPTLRDWRDIINLQRHWIGECNGYAFTLLTSASNLLRVWTANPEHLKDPNAFLVLRSKHYLSKLSTAAGGGLSVENPFAGTTIPVVFSDEAAFPPDCDVYLAAPSFRSEDRELWDSFGLAISASGTEETRLNPGSWELLRKEVLQAATRLNAGGYRVSSKLQDWLISRQRYWGTPIPIVHCPKCGAVPVPEEQLPVTLPKRESQDSLLCECPKCGGAQAKRETDTMDTFVDSSWYYLRFLDAHNSERIFDPSLASQFMPVDLYIGGKEHAVLHLYYARFMNHFLNKCGLSPTSEPFSRLLVQGMVMGRSFRVKGSGRYVREDEVEVVNAKKNQALLKETQEPVVMTWEKMSKSKQNGVEPGDMFDEYGTDTTRLIILADVAPTSHRNWSSATFPGILNWQKRLWLTLQEFQAAREEAPSDVDVNSEEFLAEDAKLFDARNFYVKGATFNYRHAHQLSVAISKMQGLTNSIRRTPKHIQRHGRQFERALAAQIIMLAPMAPHFASELWSKFVAVKGRLNEASPELQWAEDVLSQRWPDIDAAYNLELSIKVNGFENCVIKVQRTLLDKVTHSDALDIAFNTESVTSYLIDKKIRTTNFVLYPGIEAILNIYVDKVQKKEKPASSSAADKVLADP